MLESIGLPEEVGFFCIKNTLYDAARTKRNSTDTGVTMQHEVDIPMHVDDLNEAIREAIRALGGMKTVGAALKGNDYSPVEAGRWLADCLNPDRRFRLTPEQLAYIRREARKVGCHVLAAYEARDAGYAPPQPIAPQDEAAELMRNFIATAKALQIIHDKLAGNPPTLRAVG